MLEFLGGLHLVTAGGRRQRAAAYRAQLQALFILRAAKACLAEKLGGIGEAALLLVNGGKQFQRGGRFGIARADKAFRFGLRIGDAALIQQRAGMFYTGEKARGCQPFGPLAGLAETRSLIKQVRGFGEASFTQADQAQAAQGVRVVAVD